MGLKSAQNYKQGRSPQEASDYKGPSKGKKNTSASVAEVRSLHKYDFKKQN
jgi:hypothetical protein